MGDMANMANMDDHAKFMQQALKLARLSWGQTAPNPSVGCVIANADGQLVGTGWTQPAGRPHAENIALQEAGEKARGGTAYVSLEPCAHYGQTPPCATALIEAGLRCVHIGHIDPDPRVRGKGCAMLQAAGIEVMMAEAACAQDAENDNRGFLLRVTQGRPLVTLKLAVSADGFMRTPDTPDGKQQWITKKLARDFGHLLRAQHDAIITGRGTLLADNPRLDCRLSGMADMSPVPVVMARNGVLPQDSHLAHRAEHGCAQHKEVLVYGQAESVEARAGESGTRIILDALTPQAVLADLAARGINRVLLESGPSLAAAFLAAGLVDQLAIFTAPHNIKMHDKKSESKSDLACLPLDLENDFTMVETLKLGADMYVFYRAKHRK